MKGKKLEYIIKLIYEAFKDNPKTEIFPNYRVADLRGRSREIDLFIKTTTNNIDFKIAIECKDNKRPVSVDKIEAFNSKCIRIPQINKKIFISTGGFQKGAVEAAKDFGIELNNLRDVTSESIIRSLPIYNFELKLYVGSIILPLQVKDITIPMQARAERQIYHDNYKSSFNLLKLTQDNIWKHHKLILDELIEKFIDNTDNKENYSSFKMNFKLNGFYIYLQVISKIYLPYLECSVYGWFKENDYQVHDYKEYLNFDGIKKATYVSISFDENFKKDVIIKHNDEKSLCDEKDNQHKHKFHNDTHLIEIDDFIVV